MSTTGRKFLTINNSGNPELVLTSEIINCIIPSSVKEREVYINKILNPYKKEENVQSPSDL